MPLKIIFAGSPEFAAISLRALLASHHNICAVYTQPDRPSGRGRKLHINPVKQVALLHNIPLFQPDILNNPETIRSLENHKADIMVVSAYGQLLAPIILNIPKYGCINIHASLLPRWRGAAPIERAIEAGDLETGISIMQMDEFLDTGDILEQVSCPINQDTGGSLTERLAKLGAEVLLKVLDSIEKNKVSYSKQDDNLACYARKINKEEARIDWKLSAEILERKIRAFNPRPVVFTELNGQLVRVWEAVIIPLTRPTGTLSSCGNEKTRDPSPPCGGRWPEGPEGGYNLPATVITASKQGIDVQAGNNTILRLLTLQLPGGKPLGAQYLINKLFSGNITP